MRVARLLLLAAVLADHEAGARGLPLLVELDGCVEPAEHCSTRDVVKLNEGDRKLSFAVEELRVRSGHASSGSVLQEMKLRPLTVHGPDELVHRLTPGAHLRVRAALRLHQRYLIVQGAEERGSPAASEEKR